MVWTSPQMGLSIGHTKGRVLGTGGPRGQDPTLPNLSLQEALMVLGVDWNVTMADAVSQRHLMLGWPVKAVGKLGFIL